MREKKKVPVTELNDNDRKILDKYTKYYTNFIESNTSDNNLLNAEFKPSGHKS